MRISDWSSDVCSSDLEAIATDAIARFHRQQGRDVFFMTGTDEHGMKMAQAARSRGMEPRALADEMSSYFKDMDDTLNISYDRFIRTTEPAHPAASPALWEAVKANGDKIGRAACRETGVK